MYLQGEQFLLANKLLCGPKHVLAKRDLADDKQ